MTAVITSEPFPPDGFEKDVREVPQAYFNGFAPSISNADIGLALLLDNAPTLKLNMSYTTAKSLAVALKDVIETLEKQTKTKIMTAGTVNTSMEKLLSANKNDK